MTRRVFWSDSKIVLKWINKDPVEFKIFVANRLSETREKTNVSEWRWINSENNLADDATRYVPTALENHSRWFLGPPFLYEHETQWPYRVINLQMDPEIEQVVHTTNSDRPLIDFRRFSTLTRLIASVARVLKCVDIWVKRKTDITATDRFITAELICIKASQQNSFHDEILKIKKDGSVKKNSRIIMLTP